MPGLFKQPFWKLVQPKPRGLYVGWMHDNEVLPTESKARPLSKSPMLWNVGTRCALHLHNAAPASCPACQSHPVALKWPAASGNRACSNGLLHCTHFCSTQVISI